jgi:hypothetical protein
LGLKIALGLIIAAAGFVALTNDRLQRFRSLEDTSYVSERVAGSVNRSFIDVLVEYPLGNGLGGGGTSIPHFLEGQLNRPVAVENEYARIALELGIPGLLLWLSFVFWILTRGFRSYPEDPWNGARRVTWVLLFINFAAAMIGVGMMTSIPGTMSLMMWCGWLVTKPAGEIQPVAVASVASEPTSSMSPIEIKR